MKRFVFLAIPIIACASCTSLQLKAPDAADQTSAAWRNAMYERMKGASEVNSQAGSRIPVLGSEALAAEWGKPSISRTADGSLRIRYQKRGELYGLVCHSLTSPVPTPDAAPAWVEEFDYVGPSGTRPKDISHPQQWRTATVAGHQVRWCQLDGGGGADFPTYSTECFSHTDADGRTGYYIVHAWSDADEKVLQLLKKAEFLTEH